MPAAALGLKEYLSRCSPGGSKMSDNDDSTAPLGDSEALSVQHSPGEAIPEVSQRPDDGTHVPSSMRRQEARDVLEDDPTGRELAQEPDDVPVEP